MEINNWHLRYPELIHECDECFEFAPHYIETNNEYSLRLCTKCLKKLAKLINERLKNENSTDK